MTKEELLSILCFAAFLTSPLAPPGLSEENEEVEFSAPKDGSDKEKKVEAGSLHR